MPSKLEVLHPAAVRAEYTGAQTHAAAAVAARLPEVEEGVQPREEVGDGAGMVGGRSAEKTRHLTRRCGCLR